MDRNCYLRRIGVTEKAIRIDEATLIQLHESHVFNVPFENLDIHYKRLFDLEPRNVYNKVVADSRGGFCYELNSLFNWLLCGLGFKSKIISSRIFDDAGGLGPAYDHMSIYVETTKKFLLDVGFGDLFIKPLEIKNGIQTDGRSFFKIEELGDSNYLLSMSSNRTNFHKKYIFNLVDVTIDRFHDICFDKQTNPMSYFVKNTVCTKPTTAGRVTLFNDKLVEKRNGERFEKVMGSDEELRFELKEHFAIVMR